MTDKERLNNLELKVQKMQEANYVRFLFFGVTLLGITGYIIKQAIGKK